MQLDELILVVVEGLKTMKTAQLALLLYLCNRLIQVQKPPIQVPLLDLQAILHAELLQRGVDMSNL